MDKYMLRSDFSLVVAAWSSGKAYKVDQLVQNGGPTYVCILAHTSSSTDQPGTGANWATYWRVFCVGAQGPKGDTGNPGTMAARGNWATSTAYAVNDIVQHPKTWFGISSYICILAHTSGASSEPEVGASWTTYWNLFVSGGTPGTGTGDVSGPASSTTDNVVLFRDTSGKAIKDGGSKTSVVNDVLLAESTSTNAPSGTTDRFLVDENGSAKRKTVNTMFTRWVSIPIVAAALMPTTTSGAGTPSQVETGTNKHNFKSMAFGNTAKAYATAVFDLPEGYDGGSIKAFISWYSTGTTSNGVRWGVQGASIADGESLDPTWGTAVEITDNATGAAYRKLKTAVINSITLSGTPAAGEMASIRVYRDPTHGDDNLDELVYLLSIKLLVKVNTQSEA